MGMVTVPKDVVEAIKECRNKGMSDWPILEYTYTAKGIEDKPFDSIRKWAFEGGGGSPDLLMEALVNGYEIERTPYEELKDYYDTCHDWFGRGEEVSVSERQRQVGRAQGVMRTLDILGIEVEGINVREMPAGSTQKRTETF